MTSTSRLDPPRRAAALAALGGRQLDVLVVGGGITGIGIALDAVTRGLDVGLVERDDFASGTSSRSSKLIHGGLRYLEQRNFGLVREALHERELLLTRLAPHLVHPVPFLLPVHSRSERAYFGAGVALYEALRGRGSAVPRHRHLGRTATLRTAPAMRADGVVGSIRYFDAQTDDARFALTLLRTAAAHGAHVASRTEAVGFLGTRRIEGVRLRDLETRSELEARAKVTVLAAGVWAGALETLAGVADPISIRASKGVHILVPRDRLELSDALILRTERSVLLVIPWKQHWLIGTTDTPWTRSLDRPTATADDVVYLLERLNPLLRRHLAASDVTAAFAGLRPLVGVDGDDTAKLSRNHVIRRPLPGLVTVAGGKFTTYRVMAADAVDAAIAAGSIRADGSCTSRVPLIGADGLDDTRRTLAARGLDVATRERLLTRYGGLAVDVLAQDEAAPLPGAPTYLGAEIAYAVTHEGALRLEDVLTRRTRIALETADGGRAAAPAVAQIMQRHLGWPAERVDAELDAYRAWLETERGEMLQ